MSVVRTVTTVDGLDLAVGVTAGDGPPVLMVHGFGSAGGPNWERTGWVRSLQGRLLVTVDLRGHGRSGKPHDPARYRLSLLLDDLATVVADVAPGDDWDLVGYSLGGRLVTEFAARVPCRRLVVGGYAGGPLLRNLDATDLDAAFAGQESSAEATRLAGIAAAVPGNDQAALRALLLGLSADPDLGRVPPAPEAPTLVVVGRRDPIADRAQAWADVLPDARFLSVPGRGHISVVTSADFRRTAVDHLTV